LKSNGRLSLFIPLRLHFQSRDWVMSPDAALKTLFKRVGTALAFHSAKQPQQ